MTDHSLTDSCPRRLQSTCRLRGDTHDALLHTTDPPPQARQSPGNEGTAAHPSKVHGPVPPAPRASEEKREGGRTSPQSRPRSPGARPGRGPLPVGYEGGPPALRSSPRPLTPVAEGEAGEDKAPQPPTPPRSVLTRRRRA